MTVSVPEELLDRPTIDLDFFAPYPRRIDEVVGLVQGALEADGLQVTRLDDRPSFARLRIESAEDTSTVDLATDARLMGFLRSAEGLSLSDRTSRPSVIHAIHMLRDPGCSGVVGGSGGVPAAARWRCSSSSTSCARRLR